jgi:acetylornithine deacetylase/succinyl-diaminopimelate desuccinylase-like protein
MTAISLSKSTRADTWSPTPSSASVTSEVVLTGVTSLMRTQASKASFWIARLSSSGFGSAFGFGAPGLQAANFLALFGSLDRLGGFFILASVREFEMIHGTNERMTLDNLARMTDFYARLVATAAR